MLFIKNKSQIINIEGTEKTNVTTKDNPKLSAQLSNSPGLKSKQEALSIALISAASTQMVNVQIEIFINCIMLKVLCISKYKSKKNYFVDRIIFSNASKCALKAFSPALVTK